MATGTYTKIWCGSAARFWSYASGQTDAQTQTYSSHYRGEVKFVAGWRRRRARGRVSASEDRQYSTRGPDNTVGWKGKVGNWYTWWQVEVIHAVPKTMAPAHHVMKDVKPILSENVRLSKSIMGDLRYDNQQTGAPSSHASHHCRILAPRTRYT